MGGKKKLNLKQMERMQGKKDEEEKEKGGKKTGPPRERKALSIVPPDARNEKIVAELKKMNVLTPYTVATKFGIRMSVAKDFLEQLEQSGKIQMVSGNHSIKIYKPVAA